MANVNGDLRERPVGELARHLLRQVSALLHNDVALAKVELKSQALDAALCAALLGVAALLATFAFAAFTTAFVLALALALPAWGAALVVAVVYGAGGLAFALIAYGRARTMPAPARQTIQTLKDDVANLEPTLHAIAFKADVPARVRERISRRLSNARDAIYVLSRTSCHKIMNMASMAKTPNMGCSTTPISNDAVASASTSGQGDSLANTPICSPASSAGSRSSSPS